MQHAGCGESIAARHASLCDAMCCNLCLSPQLVADPFWLAVVEPLDEVHDRPKAEALLILSYAVFSARVASKVVRDGVAGA